MNDEEREELESLLREALHREAARVVPAGDGLERVRARVAGRRRAPGWLRPAIAIAAASAVVALVGIAPLFLRDGDGGGDRTTSGGQLAASPQRPSTAGHHAGPHVLSSQSPTTPTRSGPSAPASGGVATLPDGSGLTDMTTVWPYGSRREGSRHADADARRPELVDPGRAAVAFVESFVGSRDDLTSDSGARMDKGLGVHVYRELSGGRRQPVSLVYLVRVRPSDLSPYVVVDATSPRPDGHGQSITVHPGSLDGTSEVVVDGTLSTPARIASLKVELREPDGRETLASSTPEPVANPDVPGQKTWSAPLTPFRALNTPTGTVAAWTVDDGGHLVGFAAVPTGD